MKKDKAEQIGELIGEYRRTKNLIFDDIKYEVESIIGEKDKEIINEVKSIFIENLAIKKEFSYSEEEMKIREIYDSYRILELVK